MHASLDRAAISAVVRTLQIVRSRACTPAARRPGKSRGSCAPSATSMPLADYTVRSGRWYSATPVVSAGNETKPNKTRVFWAQRPGAVGSAMLTTSAAQVGSLVVEVANLLKLEAPLDSIVLQLVAKDKNGMDCSVRLNNMDTIKKALAKASKELGRPIHPKENLSLVASVVAAPLAVVAAPLAASAAGELWG